MSLAKIFGNYCVVCRGHMYNVHVVTDRVPETRVFCKGHGEIGLMYDYTLLKVALIVLFSDFLENHCWQKWPSLKAL